MLTSLKKSREVIALEASVTEAIADFMKKGFDRVYGDIKGFLVNFAPPTTSVKYTRENKDFFKIIEKHRYDEIMDIRAYVPEGLSVDYLTYLHALDRATLKLENLIPVVLRNYVNFLGALVNFEEEAKNTWIQFQAIIKIEEKELNEVVALFSNSFAKNSNITETTLDKVVKRNSDWDLVFKEIDVVNERLHRIDRGVIEKSVSQAVTYLDVIKQNIEKGKYASASAETVKTMADMAYLVANELEFYAVVFYKVEALNKSLKDTCLNVVNAFKV